jgi:hypothetical protein
MQVHEEIEWQGLVRSQIQQMMFVQSVVKKWM